jgi:hypothetical protein
MQASAAVFSLTNLVDLPLPEFLEVPRDFWIVTNFLDINRQYVA